MFEKWFFKGDVTDQPIDLQTKEEVERGSRKTLSDENRRPERRKSGLSGPATVIHSYPENRNQQREKEEDDQVPSDREMQGGNTASRVFRPRSELAR